MSQAHILVVEDDPEFGPLLRTLLARLGYEVTLAPSGAAAMQAASRRDFEVITLDINIPDIDGVDLLEHFRTTVPGTPVIMATAQAGSERVIRCLRIGAFDFLKKPFDVAILKPTIERALEHRRLRQTAVLYRGSQAITDAREPARLPKALVEYAVEAFGADWAGIFAPGSLEVSAARGDGLRERIDARMVTRGPTLLDLGEHERAGILEEGHLAYHGLRSTNGFHGTLALWRAAGRPVFRNPDLETIGVYAAQASLALENARLMTRLRERVEALERVRARMATGAQLETVGRRAVGLARRVQRPLSVGRVFLRDAAGAKSLDESRSLVRRAIAELDSAERIAAEMETLARTRDNVSSEIRRILETAASLALDDRAAELAVDLEMDARVPGQPGDLVQMFVHLIDNAARALRAAEKPLRGNLRVSGAFAAGQLTLTLRDEGCGMDEATLKRWGEPFFSTWGSTGLGGAMCANVIQRHEGALSVDSARDGGTSVTVVLPAVAELGPIAMDSTHSTQDSSEMELFDEDDQERPSFS